MRLRDLLIPLMLVSSVLMGIMPTTMGVTVNPGVYYTAYGGLRNYTVSHVMSFSSITISSSSVMFNNTMIVPYSNPSSSVTYVVLDYIHSDTTGTAIGDKVIEFNYTWMGSVCYFWIWQFKNSHQYRVVRNGVNWVYPTSDASGTLVFTTTVSGTNINIEIYDYAAIADTTKPSITINFAGNHGEKGGPYYLPPGESTALSGTNLDGYYANSSYQSEDFMYMNLTVTDDVAVSSVMLHWKNIGTGVWDNLSGFTKGGSSNYWTLNKTGVVAGQYSFDILATDSSGNVKLLWWNKTGLGGSYTRRSVYLAQIPSSIEYKPLYFYDANYSYALASTTKDRLRKDQGVDGGTAGIDTAYLRYVTPTDIVSYRTCSAFVGGWFDNDSCVSPLVLNNVYYHLWEKSSSFTYMEHYYGKSRVNLLSHPGSLFNRDDDSASDNKSNIVYGGNTYRLISKLGVRNTGTDYDFTDNNLYEFYFGFESSTPKLISNRSFTSFILLNVPSNASLNVTGDTDGDLLSDWTELYQSFTNPFLMDTDDDGVNDSSEYFGGSDPNDYTEFTIPFYFPPTVFTNASTNVEETSATLNGWIADNGGKSITSFGFNYGTDLSYGTTINNFNYTYRTPNDGYYSGLIKRDYGPFSKTYDGIWADEYDSLIRFNTPCSGFCMWNYTTLITVSGIKLAGTGDTTNGIILTAIRCYSNGSWVTAWSGSSSINNFYNIKYINFSSVTNVNKVRVNMSMSIVSIPAIYEFAARSSFSEGSWSYLLNSLNQGTLYHFRAYATNSEGTSYGSDRTFFTKPDAPTGLSIVNTGLNNNQVLSWVHGLGYDATVLRAKVGSYPSSPVSDTSIYNGTGTSKTVNHTILFPGRLYYYRAWEYASDSGLYRYSDANSSTIGLTKPFAPTNTAINIISSTSINLSWTKGTGANKTIIVYKSTGIPTSSSDGIVVYNGTGTYIPLAVANGSVYYYAGFSYSNFGSYVSVSDNGTTFTNITGVGFVINCFNETTGLPLTFNVFITNADGTDTYNKSGCTNPQIINSYLCPLGNNIQIVVSAANHNSRLYNINLFNGIIYTLNAYLPYTTTPSIPTNTTYLYKISVIDQASRAISNVHIVLKGIIANSSYSVISDVYTDGYGQYNFHLYPNKLYKFLCYKDGYADEIANFIPTTIDFTFTIQMHINDTVHPTYLLPEQITFNGYLNNATSMLYANYTDLMSQTINWQLYVYYFNSTTNLWTLISTDTGTSSSFSFSGAVNNTWDYKVIIFFNHTYFGSKTMSFYLFGYPSGIPHNHASETINTVFNAVFKYNPFGWANTVAMILILCFFFMFGRRETYITVMVIGISLLAFHVWLGLETVWTSGVLGGILVGISFPIFLIIISILMLVRDRGMFGSP